MVQLAGNVQNYDVDNMGHKLIAGSFYLLSKVKA